MRIFLLSFTFVNFLFGQTGNSSGTSQTLGNCSPAVSGNNNSFHFSCTGISAKQARDLNRILNRILSEQLDAARVYSALSSIQSDIREIKEGRSLSVEQSQAISTALAGSAIHTLSVHHTMPAEDGAEFAKQIKIAIKRAGWQILESVNEGTGTPFDDIHGVVIFLPAATANAEDMESAAKSLQAALLAGGIQAPIENYDSARPYFRSYSVPGIAPLVIWIGRR